MAPRKARGPKRAPTSGTRARFVEYLLGKGTPQFFPARVEREAIRLVVNGPGMLYGSVRLLVSLDMASGATFHAWSRLAGALRCTSYCGRNGTTPIPVTVETSRIGTCLAFSTGPMQMYQSLVVLRPKQKGRTLRAVIDAAFGGPERPYTAILVPEPATGHAEHDASIFLPPADRGGHDHEHDHHGHP